MIRKVKGDYQIDPSDHAYPFSVPSIETLSEAVKILKGEYCLTAIDKFKMDRALIFCRTKLDCDNLERYFIKQGGGSFTVRVRLTGNDQLRLIFRTKSE